MKWRRVVREIKKLRKTKTISLTLRITFVMVAEKEKFFLFSPFSQGSVKILFA